MIRQPKTLWLSCFACLVLLLAAAPVFAQDEDEIRLESDITTVKVYLNRASITEVATRQVPAGTHVLVFSGLSRNLQPKSITTEGRGGGVIQSVTHRISYLNRTAKPRRMLMLEDSLEVLAYEVQHLDDRKFALEQEQSLILKNNQVLGTQGMSSEELLAVAKFYRERLPAIRKELQDIAIKRNAVNTRMQQYRAELQDFIRTRDQPTNEVVVVYRTEQATRVALKLDYLVTGASWSPLYDLRVAQNGRPIALDMKANVVNNTGIDWSKVKLSLSTANPTQGGTPPSLSAQYISIYSPPVASRRERSAASGSAPAADEDSFGGTDDFGDFGDGFGEAEAAAKSESAAQYTQVNVGDLAIEYEISLPYTIPADAKPRLVDINQAELPVKFQHFAIPKRESAVYLRAGISGWDELNLLPGKANVYYEGAYLSETNINPSQTQDTLWIGLGIDPSVIIEREQVRDYTSKRVIGSNVREQRGYTITVRNGKPRSIDLVLLDQIPVSQNKEIEVTPIDLGGGELTAYNGILKWTLTIGASSSQKVAFSFEVKYPKDERLVGF